VSDIDDWSSSEDAMIIHGLAAGASWDSLANSLLRGEQELIERAAELQRRADRQARLDALMGDDDDEDDDDDDDEEDEPDVEDDGGVLVRLAAEPTPAPAPTAITEHEQQDLNEEAVRDELYAAPPAPTPAAPVYTAPAPEPGKCRVCGKPIGMDDKITRLYCSTGCAAEGKRLDNLDRYRKMKARVVIPADIAAPNPFACRINKGAYRCCLRPRHSGDHLTDHGIIFSRDGKDVWRDVDDAYLMMCLNNDMVAPQA
jgi:predicted nucleic acid-binding Zn ribbon protein